MTKNLPSLETIAGDGDILHGLELDALSALLENCEAQSKIAGAAKKAITGHIEERYAPKINGAFLAQSKDTGTVHVTVDGFDIEATRAKKVDWDQLALAAVRDRIAEAGDNPAEYLRTTFVVDERAYQAWPSFIRSQFEPARSVKPGPTSIKLAPAKSEAA